MTSTTAPSPFSSSLSHFYVEPRFHNIDNPANAGLKAVGVSFEALSAAKLQNFSIIQWK